MLNRALSCGLLSVLAACGTNYPGARTPDWRALSLTSSVPSSPSVDGPATATAVTPVANEGDHVVPVGFGLTLSPSTVLVGTALDIPLDQRISVGPAIHYGYDNDKEIVAAFLQAKYFFRTGAREARDQQARVLPFVQAGLGATFIDRDGRSADSGFLVNFGAGVRILTGDNYRLGSTALVNILPGDVGGESLYLSWEVLQVVFTF